MRRLKRSGPFILLGIVAFLLFAVFTLPARVALGWFTPAQASFEGVSGSIWQGRAQVLQWENWPLGSIEWTVHPLALISARVRADVSLKRIDGFARGIVTIWPSGRLKLTGLTASLPLNALPSGFPAGWGGTLNLKFADLVMEQGWPIQASGQLDALGISGPASRPVNFGSYRLDFAAAEPPTTQQPLIGALTDTGGPLQVSGALQLLADRSYVIEGLVAPRAEASPEMTSTLEFLGPADQEGRRPFSLAGSF